MNEENAENYSLEDDLRNDRDSWEEYSRDLEKKIGRLEFELSDLKFKLGLLGPKGGKP